MKKIDLGQTVSVLANLGVIAGIAFLGFELRQNTVALRSSATQGIYDQMTALQDMLISESLEGLMSKALNTPFELTVPEASKANALLLNLFRVGQNIHFQIQQGVYDANYAEGFWQEMRDDFEQPGYQLFWETQKALFDAEFREFVDNVVMTREPRKELDFIGTIRDSRQAR